jgi:hypothetical protein
MQTLSSAERYVVMCFPEGRAAATVDRVVGRAAAVLVVHRRSGSLGLRHESWRAVRRFLMGEGERVVAHGRRTPMPVALIRREASPWPPPLPKLKGAEDPADPPV